MRIHLRKQVFALSMLLLPVAGVLIAPKEAAAQRIAQQVVQAEAERVLEVTGRSLITIPTTLTQVSLGVLVEEKTAEAAQQEAARRSEAVVEWLRSQNVDKLATQGISLSPIYDNNSRSTRVIVGYSATNTVSFRLPTEAAGAVMDEAVRVGATNINGVSFVAEESAIAAARTRALESATQDARAQANTVLSTLGLSLQEVINISIGSLSAPAPTAARARSFAEADVSATSPVVGREQTINAQVTLRIRY